MHILISVFLFLCSFCAHADSFQEYAQKTLVSRYENADLSRQLSQKEKQIAHFYDRRQFAPAWVSDDTLNPATEMVLDTIAHADEEGLDSRDYARDLEKIKALIGHTDTPQDRMTLELAITALALDYIDDLFGERLSPQAISSQLRVNPTPIDAGAALDEGFRSGNVGSWFQNLTITHPGYQSLKTLLGNLREIQKNQGWPKVTKGDEGALMQLLRLQGDDNIQAFQARHALEGDGAMGPETLKALNTSVEQRIEQVIVTMERWRWFPRTWPERYVMVNISGFYLQAFENNRKVLDMPVITGQQFRKTPVFVSSIFEVRFNPSWHVPMSIAVRDKLPLLRKNPGALAAKGYRIYDGSGNSMSPTAINWGGVSAGSFPYRIVQSPGAGNALGKLFFNIQSPYGVFLHSTNEPHLFQKAKRSLSSGCIRVSQPAELAAFVFNNPQQWSLQTIENSMQGSQTRNISLDNPTPVHITYLTAWVDDAGRPHFVPDEYGQDIQIAQALRARQR